MFSTSIPADVLDHIFSFVSHLETLVACSNDPVLYPVVARHIYSDITVQFDPERMPKTICTFKPYQLSKLVSENPSIIHWVRSLEIEARFDSSAKNQAVMKALDEFATTLMKFLALERIVLTTSEEHVWCWSAGFRAALQDRVKLLSVKDVHLVGGSGFRFSVLDDCKNLKHLSLVGSFQGAGDQFSDSMVHQLESLTLFTTGRPSLVEWVKRHITGLRSLKCKGYSVRLLPELLDVCSGTLNKLELELELLSSLFSGWYKSTQCPFRNYPHLQHLIIRANDCPYECRLLFQLAIQAIKFFNLSPRHLTLDVCIHPLYDIDFSPLCNVLPFIPRIDLYVHTGDSSLDITQKMSSLDKYGDVVRSIEHGALVFHWNETAP